MIKIFVLKIFIYIKCIMHKGKLSLLFFNKIYSNHFLLCAIFVIKTCFRRFVQFITIYFEFRKHVTIAGPFDAEFLRPVRRLRMLNSYGCYHSIVLSHSFLMLLNGIFLQKTVGLKKSFSSVLKTF